MRIYFRLALALIFFGSLSAIAQNSSPFPVTLEKELASRATNFTEVSLDKNMLNFASKFLNGKDGDDAEVKRLISKLDGIYVRTYEFDKSAQYTAQDLDVIRKQFTGSIWSSMVRSRSRSGEGDTDIYVKLVNNEIQGMFILNAEPKELDFVYISGPIRAEDLSELGGNFGVPKLGKFKYDKSDKTDKGDKSNKNDNKNDKEATK
jgi:hypothetical protein